MLSALTAVVKLDDFCAVPHNFALLLIEMCNTPHIQIRAMELLLVMVNLHMSVELFSVLFYALSQYNVHIMPTDYEEKLQFQRTYASVLHNLLSMNIQYILHSESTYYSSTPDAVRTVSVYIEKMLSVVEQSPSIRLSGDVIKDWVKVYREKNVQLCSSFQSVAMSVLHCKLLLLLICIFSLFLLLLMYTKILYKLYICILYCMVIIINFIAFIIVYTLCVYSIYAKVS